MIKESKLARAMREQRSVWLDLPDAEFPGLKVRVERPPEADFASLKGGEGRTLAVRWVWGWEGFTEEVALGRGVGSSDALAFSPDDWAAMVADRTDWIKVIVDRLVELVAEHIQRKVADQKN